MLQFMALTSEEYCYNHSRGNVKPTRIITKLNRTDPINYIKEYLTTNAQPIKRLIQCHR